MRKNAKFTVQSTPGWEWDYQQFNLKTKPDAPYHNKLVRQAISYAIDREAIVNEIYYGEALATDNQIPAGYMGHRKPMLKYPKNGDLKKAKELMAQAGVKGYEVEVITSDKDWLRKELELVAAMVSQIGITYKIKNMDMGGYNNLWLNKRFDQVLEDITLVAPDPDATSWWFLQQQGHRLRLQHPGDGRPARRRAQRARSGQARGDVPQDRRHDARRMSDDLSLQHQQHPGLQQEPEGLRADAAGIHGEARHRGMGLMLLSDRGPPGPHESSMRASDRGRSA